MNLRSKVKLLFAEIEFCDQTKKEAWYTIIWQCLWAWLIIGVLLITGGFYPQFEPTPSLSRVSDYILAWIGVLLVQGVVLVVLGTLNWQKITTKWVLELSGILVLMTGWANFGIFILVTGTPAFISMVYTWLFVAALSIRFGAVLKFTKITERNVSKFTAMEL